MVFLRPSVLAVLALACLFGVTEGQQLQPGQLPSTPPQPGQIDQAPKKDKSSTAQQSQPTEKPSTFKPDSDDPNAIRVTTQTVLVPTSVLDPDGHGYVNGLEASDFEVQDNNKPQKVTAEYTEQPMSVVLAIQANSDVEAMLPKIRKSGILLHGLVTGADSDVAVNTFDHQIHHLLDFTTDPDKIDDAMQKVTAGSSTAALIDAVSDATRMLTRHDAQNKRRRVIVLMSLNTDKGSQMHLDQCIEQIQFSGVIVYSINISKFLSLLMKKEGYPRSPNGNIPPEGLPPLPGGQVRSDTTAVQQGLGTNALNAVPLIFHSIKDLFKKTPAEALSALTGGREYSFASERALEDAVTDIGKDLNSQYTLSYTPTEETKAEPGYHTIRVTVNRPGLIIRTRAGYWWGGGQMQ